MKKVLILFSGGLDSTTLLALARSKRHLPVCLFIDYGQKNYAQEIETARRLAREYSAVLVERQLLLGVSSGLTGASTNKAAVNTRQAFVPGRNLLLVAAAASLAEDIKADEVWLGIGSYAGFHIFPDSTPLFHRLAAWTVSRSSGGRVRLKSPLRWKTKKGVLRLARYLGVPVELTYSCYAGWNPPCGECGSCMTRRRAGA